MADLAFEKGNAFGLTEAGRAWLVKACGEEPVSGLANAFELADLAEEDGLSVVRARIDNLVSPATILDRGITL